MNSKILKILVFASILFFYGALLVHKINLPTADDLPRQITIGQTVLQGHFDIFYKNIYSYTEPDFRFFNHHWLSGVIFYVFFKMIGWNGLEILKIAILLITFSILFITARKKADFWLVAATSLPAILILMERTSLRPEVFSYLFISLYLYFLIDLDDHPESKKIFWLIPMQLLWVNMHVFFSIGVMLVGGFLLEKIILNFRKFWKNYLVKKLFVLLLAVFIVSFINPRGYNGVFYSYPKGFPLSISENQSILEFKQNSAAWEDVTVILFPALVAIMLVSFVFGFRKKNFFYIFAGLATATLSLFIIRGLSLFGIIFLPAVAANFNEVFIWLREKIKSESLFLTKILNRTLLLLFFVAILWGVWNREMLTPFKPWGIGLTNGALDSINFFKENNLQGPIFNDADSGSYLIHFLYPKERVFVDNRFADAYSSNFFGDVYLPMIKNEEDWIKYSAEYDFNVIFFYQYDAWDYSRQFLYNRVLDPAWILVYVDAYNMIFVRNLVKNKDVIDKFQITPENVEQKMAHLVKSSVFEDQVAAADTFNIVGRQDLGAKTFLNIVAKWPKRSKIWMIMGEWELNNNNSKSPILAMMYLEKAVALGQKTAEAYSFLGAAYYKMGQIEKAKEALVKALEINPNRQNAKDLLSDIDKFQI